ncbi:COG1322 Predicted nuclease of restriction endonuclease-like fold, RmuC family [Candidatus Nanopelagicaceae bacterium]
MSASVVVLLTGLAIGLALGFFIANLKNKATLAQDGSATAAIAAELAGAKALVENLTAQIATMNSQNTTSAALNQALDDVKTRMSSLSTQTADAETKRAAAESAIKTQIDSMQVGNQNLLEQATKLAGALSSSQTRGRFGEVQLEMLLENAGLLEGVHFSKQDSDRGNDEISRPDIQISIPGGSRIFIDSKFPFTRFLEAIDANDEETRDSLMQQHAKDLLKHVEALAKRDYQGVTFSPDFVVLFAPFESILSESLRVDPMLLEKAFAKNVTVATPTNMLALLRTVAYAFGRQDLADNAVAIQGHASELLKRVGALHSKLATLGDRIKSVERGFNDVIQTAETSLLRPARSMVNLGVSTGANKLAPLNDVDDEVRAIKSAALEIDYIDAEEDEK